MRTKALLLTAALGMLGVASSFAQVYSVNVVGFVNLNLGAGYTLIANPLNGTNNNLSTILPNVPDGTTLFKFDSETQSFTGAATYLGGWDVDYVLAPGEGAFLFLDAPTTVTFVGEVPQGNLSNPIPVNYSIRASQVPQAGGLTSLLQFPAVDGDTVFTFNPASQSFNSASTYLGGWDIEPNIAVGESFFIFRDPSSGPGNWTRTFNVQ